VVKFTNDGFKLTNLELTGEDDAEGDAVSPPAKKAKKAKKTAEEETQRHINAVSIAIPVANIAAHTGRNRLPLRNRIENRNNKHTYKMNIGTLPRRCRPFSLTERSVCFILEAPFFGKCRTGHDLFICQ